MKDLGNSILSLVLVSFAIYVFVVMVVALKG
jgi:hypothetical protein